MANVSSSNSQKALVPKLRFPGFEGEWMQNTLGELGSFIKGAPLSKADITDDGTPFILYGELYTTYEEVVNEIVRKTTRNAAQEHISRVGDVIVPTSGETPEEIATASCIMVPGVILAGDLNIYRTQIVDGRLVSYAIRHVINRQIASVAQGKSVVHIKAEELAKISINYPSLEEQSKILQFLSLLQSRIDQQRKLIDALKSYKRGAFLNLYSISNRHEVCFKEIYLKAAEGGTPPTKNEEYYLDGNIPFAKIEDLSKHYLQGTKSFITEQGLRNSSAWLIPPESIIFSNGATIGACSINRIATTTKQGILGIVPTKDFSSHFLYHFFTSPLFMKKIRAITTKGTMDCAYLKDIDHIILNLPNYDTQIKIATTLDNCEELIEHHNQILEMLLCIKQGLLQQLFI